MKDENTTGDNDAPENVLKMLGQDGIKIMAQLINNTYETGEWPKDFTKVTMNALKKMPKATKCMHQHTISFTAHRAQIVARILRRRTERRAEDVYLEKISLDLQEEKELGMQLGC
jgi:hypothetical protein